MNMGDALSDMFAKYSDGEGAQPEPTVELQPEPQAIEPEAAPEPEQTADAQPAEPEAQPEPAKAAPEPGHVPIAALLDEREKRRDLERRLSEFESRQRQQQDTQAAPSIYEDPEGYQAAVDHRLQQAEVNTRFAMSERFAVQQHGADLVKAAQAWAVTQDPYTRQAIFNDPDPVGSAVDRYKRDQTLSQIGNDPDAYVRRRAVELGLVGAAPPAPQGATQQQPARTPTRSLASAPGAAGTSMDTPVGSALEGMKFNLDR